VLRAFAAEFAGLDARALIVGAPLFGEDDFDAALKALVIELGVETQVEFTGHVTDVSAQLARMHIVVHASTVPEPFGQVVIEAMAARRPVIAADAGGPAEIITDGVDGLLTPPGDVGALARALRRLHDDPVLRDGLAAAGQRRSADFDPHRLAQQVERLYRRVLR
jgi:glycosyltransferase involved in cell wall biosynthesis